MPYFRISFVVFRDSFSSYCFFGCFGLCFSCILFLLFWVSVAATQIAKFFTQETIRTAGDNLDLLSQLHCDSRESHKDNAMILYGMITVSKCSG